MNTQLRSYAGWCVPNSSDAPLNNRVGRILAHSKTLMFSIDMESWAGVEETPGVVSLTVVSPARGECRMTLAGPAGTEVRVRLYDVAGRLVSTVYEGTLAEESTGIVWDGMDSDGHRAASGVVLREGRRERRARVLEGRLPQVVGSTARAGSPALHANSISTTPGPALRPVPAVHAASSRRTPQRAPRQRRRRRRIHRRTTPYGRRRR